MDDGRKSHDVGGGGLRHRTGPDVVLVVPAWPEVEESTVKALREPLFQDYFSLIFVKYHEGKDCFLTVNNECGNVSFQVMAK